MLASQRLCLTSLLRVSISAVLVARLKYAKWTEDEAHNLTHDDPVWELVKAADQAVLATATPLKQVAELQGVARSSVFQILKYGVCLNSSF